MIVVDDCPPCGRPDPKVVHPSGVSLRNEPCTGADRTVHVLGYGEVFVACERQWVRKPNQRGLNELGPGFMV